RRIFAVCAISTSPFLRNGGEKGGCAAVASSISRCNLRHSAAAARDIDVFGAGLLQSEAYDPESPASNRAHIPCRSSSEPLHQFLVIGALVTAIRASQPRRVWPG